MPTDCNSLVTVCASKTGPKPSPLDPMQPVMERSHPTSGRSHPGRHQSERPADFDRNKWPTSIGMPGRHHRNAQSGWSGRGGVRAWPAGSVCPRVQVWPEELVCGGLRVWAKNRLPGVKSVRRSEGKACFSDACVANPGGRPGALWDLRRGGIGGHPAYLGRLVNYSQLFQVILYFYRDEINEKRQAETLAKFAGKILKRHQRRQSRSRKSSSPQSVASPSAAAPTPPGQMKKDSGSSARQLQRAMSQSPMPAGQVPPSRQSWQDLIAKRKAETAWQSRHGTSGRR